jgi:hypothetical protein
MRVSQDDLPTIRIAPLRAAGVITAETTEFLVRLGDVEKTVAVTLRRFPNGGNWSRFRCPACGYSVRMLRLLDGALACSQCCIRRKVLPRCWPLRLKERAEQRIPKLRAKLESKASLRLKPVLWGTMERRAALARCELIVAQHQLKRGKHDYEGS